MEEKYYKIAKLNPYISSPNMGDLIISKACDEVLNEIFEYPFIVNISTRDELSYLSRTHISDAEYSFFAGTNALSSDIKEYRQWYINASATKYILGAPMRKRDIWLHPNKARENGKKNKIITMGVGWWQYQEDPTPYTSMVYREILSDRYLHSVRDKYTEDKFKRMGIDNVIYTGCPTLWQITSEHCEAISTTKAENVITALTYYNKRPQEDALLLKTLIDNYKRVFLWLQSIEDYDYLRELGLEKKVEIVKPSLMLYEGLLTDKNLDVEYVGTRLHAGIYALRCRRRALIISVDNRANEMGKDINLPIISLGTSNELLGDYIYEERRTKLNIPYTNINRWKKQFLEDTQ